jgi:hypothetical protein
LRQSRSVVLPLEDHPHSADKGYLSRYVFSDRIGLRALAGLWVLQRQWPLVVSNGVCFLLSAFILTMTLLPRSQKEQVAGTLIGENSDAC